MSNTIAIFGIVAIFLSIIIAILTITLILLIPYSKIQYNPLSPAQKQECTARTQGKITTTSSRYISITTPFHLGFAKPSIAFVTKYKVQGKTYKIKEEVALVTKQLPLGFIRKAPFHVRSWRKVTVCYNPHNPQEAYVLENTWSQ